MIGGREYHDPKYRMIARNRIIGSGLWKDITKGFRMVADPASTVLGLIPIPQAQMASVGLRGLSGLSRIGNGKATTLKTPLQEQYPLVLGNRKMKGGVRTPPRTPPRTPERRVAPPTPEPTTPPRAQQAQRTPPRAQQAQRREPPPAPTRRRQMPTFERLETRRRARPLLTDLDGTTWGDIENAPRRARNEHSLPLFTDDYEFQNMLRRGSRDRPESPNTDDDEGMVGTGFFSDLLETDRQRIQRIGGPKLKGPILKNKGGKRKTSSWIDLVKKVQRENGCSYKEAMQMASQMRK